MSSNRKTWRVIAAAMLAVVTGGWLAGEAEAAVCGSRDSIQKILIDRYQENTRGLGLVSDKGIVELFTSKSGTWSILMTTAGGATCIIAAGHTWQDMMAELEGPSA